LDTSAETNKANRFVVVLFVSLRLSRQLPRKMKDEGARGVTVINKVHIRWEGQTTTTNPDLKPKSFISRHLRDNGKFGNHHDPQTSS
jgi:hypothetical protein